MATTQHYIWAAGHFILLTAASRYFLATALLRSVSPWWYKISFTGALLSYAIVCHKSLGVPQLNVTWVKRALLDENVQYFLLAFFWWSSKPIAVALVPYAIFSLFHALTFTRTTLMPQFLPPGPPTQSGGPPTPHPFARKLQVWVKANYDYAMRAVAYTELLILLRVVFGALLWQNSLLTPIIYAHFLRARYYQSAFTRTAVGTVKARIDAEVAKEGRPPVARTVWDNILMVIRRWAGETLEPRAAPAPAAGAARPAAR